MICSASGAGRRTPARVACLREVFSKLYEQTTETTANVGIIYFPLQVSIVIAVLRENKAPIHAIGCRISGGIIDTTCSHASYKKISCLIVLIKDWELTADRIFELWIRKWIGMRS